MNSSTVPSTKAALLAAVFATSIPASAELLVYEPFDYPDGLLNGQGGALGTTGTWSTNDTGFGDGWWCHPQGEVTGQGDDLGPVGPGPNGEALNQFDGLVDNLATAGGFAGPVGPEDKNPPVAFGTRSPTGNLDANIGLDPSVTATFQTGTTTWFSYVGSHADNRNAGSPTFMICTDPTTNGSRGLGMQNAGNGIGGVGGPPRFNLFDVYPHYFRGGIHQQAPGGYQDGVLGGHNGEVASFCSTSTCNGVLGPDATRAWVVRDGDGFMGVPNIVVGKIEWDADIGGYDIISVVSFLETDELTEAAFDAIIADKPQLSSANWPAATTPLDPANPSNKPDLDQSQFDTLNFSNLKFYVDELRIGTTFGDVTPPPVVLPPTIFQITAVLNGANVDLSWPSQAGFLYNLYSSTDLSAPLNTWTPVATDIAPTGDTTTESVAVAGVTTFFYVEEFVPPPVFALEDFESDNGGFTVSTSAGSDWQWGDPDSGGLGGAVLTGNNNSTNCWGTDIGNPGIYTVGTTTTLRSPLIDLSGVAGAELTFAEALDLGASDVAVLNVIAADGTTVLGPAVYTADDSGDQLTADWNDVGPISLTPYVGQSVFLEWSFTGNTVDYLGWYIDDVEILQAAP